MADIIDFTSRRQEKASVQKKQTVQELNIAATSLIISDWEKMARSNRLNDYFKQCLPSVIASSDGQNYLGDLNSLSKLETNMSVAPMVFAPGTIPSAAHGWIAQYRIGAHIISTPEMYTEPYARAFGLLLFLKVKGSALSSGVTF